MKKIKVLLAGAGCSFGGIECFQYNLFKSINKKLFSIDIIINNTENRLIYEKEIKQLGGCVFYIPSRRQAYLKRILIFRNLLRNNNYDVIHIHYGSLNDDMFLAEALKTDSKVILHSHSSNYTGNKLEYLLHIFNRHKYINSNFIRLACSIGAGKFMFCNRFKQNRFTIIKNGIDINKFRFNLNKRNELRQKFNLDDNTTVIGHIARFSQEKNYSFIVNILSELVKKTKNIKLLLIGDGVLKDEVAQIINDKGLSEYVLFLGLRQDISELLSIMDIFIFPSIHEGLPITLVEAQASGLKTIISDNITDEVCLTEYIHKLPIGKNDEYKWVDCILNTTNVYQRNFNILETNLRYFDCSNMVREVETIYRKNYVYNY